MSRIHHLETVEQFFTSRVIVIIAGEEKTSFHIHAAALSSSDSPSLQAHVSDKWDPSSDKVIDWSHTDVATAQRFFVYLYTNDFSVPKPQPTCAEHNSSYSLCIDEEHPQHVASALRQGFGKDSQEGTTPDGSPRYMFPPPDVAATGDSHNHTLDQWLTSGYVPRDHNINLSDTADSQRTYLDPSRANPTSAQAHQYTIYHITDKPTTTQPPVLSTRKPITKLSYKEPLFALAKLYCFAQYHLCSSLQKVTIQRFSDILPQVDCYQPNVAPELVELFTYIYDNTPPTSIDSDPLRKIVSQFTATNYISLMRGDFKDFCLQGGDFSSDVSRNVRRRLISANENERYMQQRINDLTMQLKKYNAGTLPLGPSHWT